MRGIPLSGEALLLFPVPGICPVHGDDLTPGAVVGRDGVRREKAPGSISLPHLGHFIKTLLFQGRWVFPLPVVLQRLAPQRAAPRQAGEKRGDGLCHRQAFPAGKGKATPEVAGPRVVNRILCRQRAPFASHRRCVSLYGAALPFLYFILPRGILFEKRFYPRGFYGTILLMRVQPPALFSRLAARFPGEPAPGAFVKRKGRFS